MMRDEWFGDFQQSQERQEESHSNGDDDDAHHHHTNFDFLSLVSKPKDYYKILEVDYDATDDVIRSNYIRLALKWHPDKQKDDEDGSATSKFQEINEAYQVLIDPIKRYEYDKQGMLHTSDANITDYLNRYKSLILTCNGLGMKCSIW